MRFAAQGMEKTERAPGVTFAVVAISTNMGYFR